MSTEEPNPRIVEQLKTAIVRGQTTGEMLTSQQVSEHTARFRDRFGPDALGRLDGEALLLAMHGRQDADARCLAYWLEFKNDDEFAGNSFGSIAGGSALKFGVYQRQTDGAWMSAGEGTQPKVITLDDAIAIAQRQRGELIAGARVLQQADPNDQSDQAYARLQAAMLEAAPELSSDGWSHKYWFLIEPGKIDDYHSPRYQRFHLYKLLQMPPDRVGILNASAPRFVCAGRFIAAARALDVPVTLLNRALNQRDGAFHRYWRIGTTEGDAGESQWSAMRDGSYVAIGWPQWVPDLSSVLGQEKVSTKDQIWEWLLPNYPDSPAVASRKAGEIQKFAEVIGENDLVLACEGQKVLGIGKVRGPYEYEKGLRFPHKRPVNWLSLEPWQTPEQEGLRTTVYELGRSAANLLQIEKTLANEEPTGKSPTKTVVQHPAPSVAPLPPLDPITARVESILRRKGQVILYGPPGTGKTFHALRSARELAARQRFRRTYAALSEAERDQIEGSTGLVRLCTFHPGYGYEDFIEGYRPEAISGQLVFKRHDGVFKTICADAEQNRDRQFFLVVDEINRGDIPRIFGELITSIETDKRNNAVTLSTSGSTFRVPSNVFLIGTMNTADRSISLLDVALRRRFGFVELMPDSSILAGRTAGRLPLGPWLDALNARLRHHLKRDARNLQIGHSYLLGQPISSVSDFSRILRDDIIPLLEEYCYEDLGVLRDILGSDLVDVDRGRIREEIFEANREDDLVQALSYEEMQLLTLDQEVEDQPIASDESDDEDGRDLDS